MAPRNQQQQALQSGFHHDMHPNQFTNIPVNYPHSQYSASPNAPVPPASQATQPAPQETTATSEETLEQRLLDLLHPFRDECFTDDDSDPSFTLDQRRVILTCENIAFLIRHNQTMYGKAIQAADISIISRHWEIQKLGKGQAGIAVLVNGNGYTHTVVRANVAVGLKPIQCLSQAADKILAHFFPDIPDI